MKEGGTNKKILTRFVFGWQNLHPDMVNMTMNILLGHILLYSILSFLYGWKRDKREESEQEREGRKKEEKRKTVNERSKGGKKRKKGQRDGRRKKRKEGCRKQSRRWEREMNSV